VLLFILFPLFEFFDEFTFSSSLLSFLVNGIFFSEFLVSSNSEISTLLTVSVQLLFFTFLSFDLLLLLLLINLVFVFL